ncbi:23S rRNA (guanosine(2251)-2'-O)-methyltransferase RlmB [Rhabdothermincola salaria]|uniref:23S rRNA (guanosine(2251)-2'-O)-methyltransferase RlmB n=1 Tax=Rhabdothermincola salaria TaxID=2903142 RepID=UPI001E4F16F1|nr:23S rRNA (guanosine(2251)-2'-O)-methyltransferase RlmB [Rhabdothermincola salaria]
MTPPRGSGKGKGGAGKGGRGGPPGRGAPAGRGAKGAGPAKKAAKPLSPAAKKAVEAKRTKHAAASVRKADRPGGGPRRVASGPREPGRRGPKNDGIGGDQVEGRQAVRELLLAGSRRIREIYVAEDQDDNEVLGDIVELALDLKVPVREVTRTRLFAEARTDAPQGVVAKAQALKEWDVDDLARRPSPSGAPPFLLAVDGVTDPGNLGALLRSAECAGVTGVVLPRHRAVHVTPTVTKAAAGAVEHLPMALVGGLPNALRGLRDAGVWVIGLDAGGDTDLFDLEVADQAVCLVLGAEGKGLSRLVRERCDAVAGIPLLGQLASLNVAAAGALACYEVTRRRLASPRP